MHFEVQFYICAILAVFVSGLAKGGFSGVGVLAMPIMALGVDPVRGASILLPIMVLQDSISVWTFRHSWDRRILTVMMPGMILGVILGYLFAAKVSENMVVGAVGALSALFGIQRLFLERQAVMDWTAHLPEWMGSLFGLVSGFAGQIAHAGAPPLQMWVVPRGLPRDTLIGTCAIGFAVMNWLKVPAFAALGQFTPSNLFATVQLIPFALLSTLLGVKLVRRVNHADFYRLIYVLMIVLGLKLVADAMGLFHFA